METVNIQVKTIPTRTDDVKVIITKQETLNQKKLDNVKSNEPKSNVFENFITPKYFIKTIRNLGYNNYQAHTDIIDNSFEKIVNSTFVKIEVIDNKGDKLNPYKSISIIDNGSGMNTETLIEAIKLGSETGKNNEEDLGCYGVGLQGASFSLGRRLEIYTKTHNNSFLYAKFDLDELEEIGWNAPFWREGTVEEYSLFKDKTNSDCGTIIVITKIDKATNKNLTQFTNILKRELGTVFYYYIKEFNKKIFVNGVEVQPIDPMYRDGDFVKNLCLNESIVYDGKEFKYSVFEMESVLGKTDTLEYPKNSWNQGLWIYRNYRLVGKALDLGILNANGDNYLTGLRIELQIPGDADYLFSSTATKIITEKGPEYIDQGLHNILSDKIKPFINQIKRERRKKVVTEDITPELKRDFEAIFNKINKNRFLKFPKHGQNITNIICDDCGNLKTNCACIKLLKPELDPNREKKIRQRNELNLLWEIKPNGHFNKFFEFGVDRGGRTKIIYNSEHPAWEKMVLIDNDGRMFITELLVSIEYAKKESGYYYDDNKDLVKNLDFFIEQMNEGIRINVQYN